MQSIIQQQHIKKRRSSSSEKRSRAKRTSGLLYAGDSLQTDLITLEKSRAAMHKTAIKTKVSSFSIARRTPILERILGLAELFQPEKMGLKPIEFAGIASVIIFLLLLLPMQFSGGLPGMWVTRTLNMHQERSIVEKLMVQELRPSDSSGAGYPVDLDLSRFEVLSFTEYVLQPGDTLSGIADQYGLRMDTLVSFNQIENARRMLAGNRIQIPNRDGLRHVVRQNESLASIAQNYSVNVTDVIDANNLRSQTLAVGQELFIPDARMNNTSLRMVLGELFVYPVRGRFTSAFGYRNDPFTGVRRFHNGIDIANAQGTPIRAARHGRVIDVGRHSGYGNYVIVSHEAGFQSLYAHLNTIYVRTGQYISAGQQIGQMGSTGRSTGSHLHFSIFHMGNPVDPLRYLH